MSGRILRVLQRTAVQARHVLSSSSFRVTPAFTKAVAFSTVAATSFVLADAQVNTPSTPSVDYDQVRKAIASILDNNNHDDGSLGPLFVRLAWHASGTYSKYDEVGGSDGGMIRFSPESEWGANKGLQLARAHLENIKQQFPGISYADLFTLAGVVSIEEMGGPKICWKAGRSDKPDGKSSPADGRLPDALQGSSHLRDIFYRMGFNDREIVALSGAHTLGRCHTDRSGFSGPWSRAPTTVSNEYFRLLLEETWTPKKWNGPLQYEDKSGELMMLPSDLALTKDVLFRKYVELYAKDEKIWREDFAKAFSKLLELGVKFNGEQSSICKMFRS